MSALPLDAATPDIEVHWTDQEAHEIWGSQLLDMSQEKAEAGLEAEARELERQAEQRQLAASQFVSPNGASDPAVLQTA
jgi:hypothetical protein